MITLNKISVVFNQGASTEHKALKSIDLKINQGDFIIVIGGNGAGKSTLMNVLSGDIIPNKGSIFFDQVNVTKQPTHIRSAMISRVFQDPMVGTCGTLTIEENFALCDMRGKKRKLIPALNKNNRDKYRDIVARLNLGLENRMNEPIGLLSGGQRQVLSLLMSTLQSSKLLLLDEHTAALDPKMASLVIKITEDIIKNHKLTALMITHDLKHATKLGNRILVMQNGKIVHDLNGKEKEKVCPYDLWNETQGISLN